MSLDPPFGPEAAHGAPREGEVCAEGAEAIPEATRDALGPLYEEMDESGETKEYVDTFKRDTRLDVLVKFMTDSMEAGNHDGPGNFENWLVFVDKDPQGLAEFFDTFGLMPHGKGRINFVQGLRSDPKSEEFLESRKALDQLVRFLREHYKEREQSTAGIDAHVNKPPTGETIGTGLKTLTKNFQRASGMEKTMIAASIAIGIALLYKYKDKQVIPGIKGATLSTVFMWLGAAWGVNYLSGKVAADGKTFVQRMDLFRDVDELGEDSAFKGFVEHYQFGDNQETLRSLLLMQYKVDVKDLFHEYQNANGPVGSRSIDVRKLGFYKKEVDGRAAYEIMDNVIKMTSVSEHIRRRREAARDSGEKYCPPTEAEMEAWKAPSVAMDAFQDKYIRGQLGNTKVTLFEAIMAEYHTAGVQEALRRGEDTRFYLQHIQAGKDRRLPDQAKKTAEELAESAKNRMAAWTQDDTKWGGKWVYDGVAAGLGAAATFTKDEILKPTADFISRKYRGIVAPELRNGHAYMQEKWVKKVLPEEFAATVTEPGVATVLGLPGRKFGIEVGKGVITIDDIPFDIDAGIPGNAAKATQLEAQLTTKVTDLIGGKNISQLRGLTPVWNKTEKRWEIDQVPVNGDALLGIPAKSAKLHFEIQPNQTDVKFFDGAKEVTSFAWLDRVHRDATIEKAVWERDPNLKTYLEGLPVETTNVTAHATYGAVIEANIAGLKFKAVPRTGGVLNGVDFLDVSGNKGGFEKIIINQPNGGTEFIDALSAKILGAEYFRGPFLLLEALMDNTSEGLLSRINQLAKTKLWIIPTNYEGLLSGKILQERWRTTLEFKKFETILMFSHGLEGVSMNQIGRIHSMYINPVLQKVDRLWKDIDSLTDEERVAQFDTLLGDRLETINYPNDEYRRHYQRFKDRIGRYEYAGFESTDTSLGREAQEIYQTMLYVWSNETRDYAQKSPSASLQPSEINHMNFVADEIVEKLELAKRADSIGHIRKKNLPRNCSQNEADLKAWLT